jgi:hypothetical protein
MVSECTIADLHGNVIGIEIRAGLAEIAQV